MNRKDKIGLFGGSFDPIHTGHLILAQSAMRYAGLDRVYLIPTAFPPHKRKRRLSSFADRLRMVELAIADNERFEVSLLEKSDEVSFTWESVSHFSSMGFGRDRLHLLVGWDSLRDLASWVRPDLIFENATIVAMKRSGLQGGVELPSGAAVMTISEGANDISSTRIRELVSEGETVRYLVPPAVEEYISVRGLYGPADGGEKG